MSTRGFQPVRPLGADGLVLAQVLQRASVDRRAVLRVTGHAGPTAMIWLDRLGFDRAAFVHASHVRDMAPAEVLLVPQACPADELAAMLGDARCLDSGGLLITQAPSEGPAVDAVLALLSRVSLTVTMRDTARGLAVLVARRAAASGLRRAA